MSWIYDHQKWKEDLVNGDIGGNKKETQNNPSFDVGFSADYHTEEVLHERDLPNTFDSFKRKEKKAKRKKNALSTLKNTAGALFLAAATVAAVPPLRYPAVDFLEQQLYRLQFKENRYSSISIVDDSGNEMYPSVVENRLERLMRWYDNDLTVNGQGPTELLTILDASMTRSFPEVVERGTTEDNRQFVRYQMDQQMLDLDHAIFSFYASHETDGDDTHINVHAYSQPLNARYQEYEEAKQNRLTIPYETIETFVASFLNRYQDEPEENADEEYFQLVYDENTSGTRTLSYTPDEGVFGHIRVVDENDEPIPLPKLEEQMAAYFENKDQEIAFFNNGPTYLINALNDIILRTDEETSQEEFFDLAESRFLFYSQHAEQDGDDLYQMTFLPYNTDASYHAVQDNTDVPTYTIRYENLINFYEELIEKTHNPAPRDEPVFNTRFAAGEGDTLELRLIDDFGSDSTVDDEELYVHQDYLAEIQKVHGQVYQGLANIRNTDE